MTTYVDMMTNDVLTKEQVIERIKERAASARKEPDEFFDDYLDSCWESRFIYRNFNDKEFQDSLFQGYEGYLWEHLEIVSIDIAYPIASNTYETFKQMLQFAETKEDFLDLTKALIDNNTNYIIHWTNRN